MSESIELIDVPSSKETSKTFGLMGQTGTLGKLHFGTKKEDSNVTSIVLEIESGYRVEIVRDDLTNGETILRVYAMRK